MCPTKFWFIWPSSLKGEEFLEINQSDTRIACKHTPFLAHLAITWHPASVNFSHFNLLL
jgi:hypothetical protein